MSDRKLNVFRMDKSDPSTGFDGPLNNIAMSYNKKKKFVKKDAPKSKFYNVEKVEFN